MQFFFVLLRNHKSWCDGGSHRTCIEHNFCLLHNKCFSKLIWVFCSHTVSRRYLIAENFECSIGYLRFSLKRSMMNPFRYLNLAIKHTRFGLFTLPWRNGAEIMFITFVTIHSKIACECEFLTYDIDIHWFIYSFTPQAISKAPLNSNRTSWWMNYSYSSRHTHHLSFSIHCVHTSFLLIFRALIFSSQNGRRHR